MKNLKTITGSCMCKAVHLNFSVNDEVFDACHCGMCRKWSGNPAFTVFGGNSVTFTGQEFITTYNSSEWAERGFCKNCGTHLFYRLKKSGLYNFPLGLLDNRDSFKFHLQIFVDHKPDNYNFANETEMMTEAEVIAKYAEK